MLAVALLATASCTQQFAARGGQQQAQVERENRDLRAMLAHTRRELREVRAQHERLQATIDRLEYERRIQGDVATETEGPTVSLAQPPLPEYGMDLEATQSAIGSQAPRPDPGLETLLDSPAQAPKEKSVHRPYVAEGQYRGRGRSLSEEAIVGDAGSVPDAPASRPAPGYGDTFTVGQAPPSVPGGDAAASLPGIESIEPSLRRSDPELLSPSAPGASMPVEAAPRVPTALQRTSYGDGAEAFGTGDYPAAVMAFRDFIHNNPDSAYADDAQYWIGESYLREGSHSKAIIEFNQVVVHYRSGDRAAKALLKQAEVFSTLGDDVDARLSLQKVVNHFAGSPEAAVATRMLAEGAGDQSAARR